MEGTYECVKQTVADMAFFGLAIGLEANDALQ
jgi:hypothetical protein